MKVTAGGELPETMLLYITDADHFVIAAKPLKTLEERALAKTRVDVAGQQNGRVVELPPRIYNFYHLDEDDYTVMASDKDSSIIIVTV